MHRNVLVVAEREETRSALAALLRAEGWTVTLASSTTDVLQVVRSSPIAAVLIVSTQGDPAATKLRGRILSLQPDCRVVPLTRVNSTGRGSRGLEFGIGDYLLGERELLAMLSVPHGAGRASEDVSSEGKACRSLIDLVDVLVGLLELGDKHFVSSSHRAMQLARGVAEEMQLPEELVIETVLATLVRDIGKYGIDKTIFNEAGALSEEKTLQMREHVVAGSRLIEHIEFPWKLATIVRHHHERYDGLGYPDGLRGPEIPLGARILAVVDAYVAMISERPHRACLSREEALNELERQAGFQFDPEVVEVFMRVLEDRGTPLSAIERPKLLIADQDVEFVSLLKIRLHNLGMEVRAVTNLQDALLGIIEEPPDLIVAELEPEAARSFEFLNALRQDDTLSKIPFAFLVQRFDLNLSVRVMSQGIDECLSKTEDLELIVARIRNILVRETRRHWKGKEEKRRGISGQLESMSVPDIIQMVNMGAKTACVSLSSEGRDGTFWFEAGSAVHAETGDLTGTDAFNAMLEWQSGQFHIEHGLETESKTIESGTMYLLMEALRLMDEASVAKEKQPVS
jgi:response regulator RpfG family c-di-GMP phosphodiesterase